MHKGCFLESNQYYSGYQYGSSSGADSEHSTIYGKCCGCCHDGLQTVEMTEAKTVMVKTLDPEKITVSGLWEYDWVMH